MKFIIESEHIDYFQKNGFIEFEEALSPSHLVNVRLACQQVLTSRFEENPSPFQWSRGSSQFVEGRDLSLDSATLKKWILQKAWGEIAYELLGMKPIRFAMDQFFMFPLEKTSGQESPECQDFFKQRVTLEEFCPFQGVLGGMMVGLEGERSLPPEPEIKKETLIPPAVIQDVFPHKAGNIVYFRANVPIDFPKIQQELQPLKYWMIVFAARRTVYVQQSRDPLNHALKKYGYEFGDSLKDKWHPVLIR